MPDLLFRDPDGWTHLLGEITPSIDYTQCEQPITDGWSPTQTPGWNDMKCINCWPNQ